MMASSLKGISKILWFLILLCLVFSHIYSFKLRIIPVPSRALVGIFGLIFLMCRFSFGAKLVIKNREKVVLFLFMALLGHTSLTSLYNVNLDVYYLKHIGNDFLGFSGVFLLGYVYKKQYKIFTFLSIVKIIAFTTIIQLLFTVGRYLFSDVNDFLNFFFLSSSWSEEINIAKGARLIGIGSAYFGSGCINSFILIIIAYLITNEKLSKLENLYILFAWLIIALVAPFMARTAFTGIIISLYIFLTHFLYKKINIIKKVAYIFLFVLIFIFGFFSITNNIKQSETLVLQQTKKMLDDPFQYAYFYSGFSENTMWAFPTKFKTLLIGDAKLNNSDTSYYMNTDFGYCRIIFYSGLIGLILTLLLQLTFIYFVAKKITANHRSLFYLLSFLFLILNIKGIFSIIPIASQFLLIDSNRIKN